MHTRIYFHIRCSNRLVYGKIIVMKATTSQRLIHKQTNCLSLHCHSTPVSFFLALILALNNMYRIDSSCFDTAIHSSIIRDFVNSHRRFEMKKKKKKNLYKVGEYCNHSKQILLVDDHVLLL